MSDDDIISTVNGLIATSKDGEEGYRKAAEEISDPQLQTSFLASSQACAAAARELQDLVRDFGGTPEQSGSLMGAIHRGWVDLRAAVSGRDDAAILSEVERGEEAARQNYADALKRELPDSVRAVILRQYDGVVRNYQRVREMREARHGTAAHR